MDAKTIKQDYLSMKRYFPEVMPAMGWYFSAVKPDNAMELPAGRWSCMFAHIHTVAEGVALCFSENHAGCSGAACYFGFRTPDKDAGRFLASKEGFKKRIEFGEAFYRRIDAQPPNLKYLVLSKLDQIEDFINVEVINYWVVPLCLSGLITLVNFDSPANDNAIIPFASGCQGMWTIPYGQRKLDHPKAVIGGLDPAMRYHIDPHTILLSVPAGRFHEMTENIRSSFACRKEWMDLVAAYGKRCDDSSRFSHNRPIF